MDNYRPQLFLRTADITVGLHWPEGTPDAAEKMIMPGDNVEMVCDLVHEAAAELGTRFTLREGGKTSKQLCSILPTRGSNGRLQLEQVLSQSSSRRRKPLVSYWSPSRLTRPAIRLRYKSYCYCSPPLMLSSPVLRHSPLTKSRNINSGAYVHPYFTPNPHYLRFFRNAILGYPRTALLVFVNLWLPTCRYERGCKPVWRSPCPLCPRSDGKHIT